MSSFNRVKTSQQNFISEGQFLSKGEDEKIFEIFPPFFFASRFRHFAGRRHFLSPTMTTTHDATNKREQEEKNCTNNKYN